MIEKIRHALASRRGALELDPDRLEIEPILNWGGFVNDCFRIRDDGASRFLKLAGDPVRRGRLEQWRRLSRVLERRYRAPRMIDWIELDDAPFAGPLFEWIDGATPERLSATGSAEIGGVLRRLHADEALARDLTRDDAPASCADYYAATYHDRFVEDLHFVRRTRPPFVSEARLGWMAREAETLLARVVESSAFGAASARPVHGDPWLNNLLETPENRWYVLDWDELGLGDPVVDWTMLCGPSRSDLRPARESSVRDLARLDDAAWERFDLYGRASLLDWVIDPLADWVDVAKAPAWADRVRAVKRDVHERALDAYRTLYP